MIPLKYKDKIIGYLDEAKKVQIIDEVEYQKILKENKIVGVSSRSIGLIEDNQILDGKLYENNAEIITVPNDDSDRFKLLKPLGKFKKGHIFDSFGGLVSGIEDIKFNNKEYFKLVK